MHGHDDGAGPRRAPALLRAIASRLVRGAEAGFVLADLDELYANDVERKGMSAARAGGRYLKNAAGSALTLRRAGRRSPGAGVSWLDVKLGLRMLLRYPGLAAVAILSMALGIALGAGYLEVVHDFTRPDLPLEDGHRIVGIRNEDLETSGTELRALHDFLLWREALTSVEDLGAFRTVERNLVVGTDGPAEPITVAEISPAAFRITRTPPFLGRTLVESDAGAGAPPVVVLGHEVWSRRFGGDAGVVGRTVRLGGEEATVVGVMPEEYGFPRSHRLWTPLRPDALTPGPPMPRQGPAIQVFGRLTPGTTMEEARAELATLGARLATDLPETHARLRPRLVPYTGLFGGGGGTSPGLYLIELVFVGLLALISANVATLVFARTATREGEIAVRNALGANRFRIVAQLFVEALVLALAAAVVGLLVAAWVLRWLADLFWTALEGRPPFWWDDGLAPDTVLLALGLAVLAAAIVGVLPALRATRGTPSAGLQRTASRGASLRLGGVWTGMLVFQVACAVALLPLGVDVVWRWARTEAAGLGFPAEEYLAARLEADAAGPPGDPLGAMSPGAFRSLYEELERRLEAEPEVIGVTFASALPGTSHPTRTVAVEGDPGAGSRPRPRVGFQVVDSDGGAPAGPRVQVASVAPDFFAALGATVVAGRPFQGGEAEAGDRVLVANRTFVDEVLGDRNAVGRRVRFVTAAEDDEEPWFEIVGVVEDVATDPQGLDAAVAPALYRTLPEASSAGGTGHTIQVAVHVRGDPRAFAPRLRALASAVDPELRLYDPLPLDRPVALARGERAVNELIVWIVAFVSLMTLLVSAAGTYSLMSFTVARRTREIGIRAALGADPRGLVRGIFASALRRLVLGIAVGTLVWLVPMAWLRSMQSGDAAGDRAVGILLVVGAILLATGLLACGVPARRALRIEPTEALREG